MTAERTKKLSLVGLLVLLTAGAFVFWDTPQSCSPQQLSCVTFGPAEYDGAERSSFHVDLSSGNRIAVDVIRPTKDGVFATTALPVLLTQTPYNRAARLVSDNDVVDSALFSLSGVQRMVLGLMAWFDGGEYIASQTAMMPWLSDLVLSGYVVVATDVAGTGASFGIPHTTVEGYLEDSRFLLDWIDNQDWSNGQVGVYGQSYSALTAYTAIASGHASLKAAFVSAPPLDMYGSAGFPSGLYGKGFSENYVALTADLDVVATPVDQDADEAALQEAFAQRASQSLSDIAADLSKIADKSARSARYGVSWTEMSLEILEDRIAASDAAVYAVGGWMDFFSEDTIKLARMTRGPQKLALRPWQHRLLFTRMDDFDPAVEARTWFDRWLKDADATPASRETEVYFMHEAASAERDAGFWCRLQHDSGQDMQLALTQTGALAMQPDRQVHALVVAANGFDTSGVNSRWNGVLGSGVYEDLRVLNPAALSFETHGFVEQTQFAGVVELNLQTRAEGEAAVHAFIERVNQEGQVMYLTEAISRVAAEDQSVTLRFFPTAFELAAGDKLRLTLLSGDRDNFGTATGKEPQAVEIGLGGRDGSALTLPMSTCEHSQYTDAS